MVEPIKLEKAKEFKSELVPQNIYKVKVTELRQFSGQYGEALAISFEITEGDHTGKIIDGIANLTKLTKKSKLFKWAQVLKCTMPDEEGATFDPNEMLSKECRILTADKERTNEQGKYFQSYVKEVMPAE